jgi:hypothetical protein
LWVGSHSLGIVCYRSVFLLYMAWWWPCKRSKHVAKYYSECINKAGVLDGKTNFNFMVLLKY